MGHEVYCRDKKEGGRKSEAASVRLLARILSISVSLLLASQLSPAQSIPKGLDPTAQLYSVNPADVQPTTLPTNLTGLRSAEDAESLLNAFQLIDLSTCVSGRAILLHTAKWRVIESAGATPADATQLNFNLAASQWTGFSAKIKGVSVS